MSKHDPPLPGMAAAWALARGATPSEAALVEVRTHKRKPGHRVSNSEPSKVATAATHALNRVPEDTDNPLVYAQALAGVLRRWFGDDGLAVARELVRILEGSK